MGGSAVTTNRSDPEESILRVPDESNDASLSGSQRVFLTADLRDRCRACSARGMHPNGSTCKSPLVALACRPC